MFFFVCSAVKLLYIFHLTHAFYYVWVVVCIVDLFHAILDKLASPLLYPPTASQKYTIMKTCEFLAQIGIPYVVILCFRLRNTAAMFIWLINTTRVLA